MSIKGNRDNWGNSPPTWLPSLGSSVLSPLIWLFPRSTVCSSFASAIPPPQKHFKPALLICRHSARSHGWWGVYAKLPWWGLVSSTVLFNSLACRELNFKRPWVHMPFKEHFNYNLILHSFIQYFFAACLLCAEHIITDRWWANTWPSVRVDKDGTVCWLIEKLEGDESPIRWGPFKTSSK